MTNNLKKLLEEENWLLTWTNMEYLAEQGHALYIMELEDAAVSGITIVTTEDILHSFDKLKPVPGTNYVEIPNAAVIVHAANRVKFQDMVLVNPTKVVCIYQMEESQ